MRSRGLVAALCLVMAGVPGVGAALAVEMPDGSRNFNAPGYVPNYFSNEARTFQGRAPAPSYGGAPAYATPAPRERAVIVSGRHGRYRVVAGGHIRGHIVVTRGRGRHVGRVAGRSRPVALHVRSHGLTHVGPVRGRAAPRGGGRMARR